MSLFQILNKASPYREHHFPSFEDSNYLLIKPSQSSSSGPRKFNFSNLHISISTLCVNLQVAFNEQSLSQNSVVMHHISTYVLTPSSTSSLLCSFIFISTAHQAVQVQIVQINANLNIFYFQCALFQ